MPKRTITFERETTLEGVEPEGPPTTSPPQGPAMTIAAAIAAKQFYQDFESQLYGSCFCFGVSKKNGIIRIDLYYPEAEFLVDKGFSAVNNMPNKPKWRNWQTRGIQNPVLATG